MTTMPNQIQQLIVHLDSFTGINGKKTLHYEGEYDLTSYGLSVPPQLRGMKVNLGWGGTIVDSLEERLNWLGWYGPSGAQKFLKLAYDKNQLEVEACLAHLDSLIYGVCFVTVGSGSKGEPHPLITIQSPLNTTGIWDSRTRRMKLALTRIAVNEGEPDQIRLYELNRTSTWVNDGQWKMIEEDQHNLNRVLVAALPNRPRASRGNGRSELSRPIREMIEEGTRILMAMSVNREFYSAPQRWAMGVDPDDFSGNGKGWAAVMGRVWAMGKDEDGELPKVGEFQGSPSTTYLDQLRGLAVQVASASGMPENYFGYPTVNPSSADAIRAGDNRLNKKAERRQSTFTQGWLEVAYLALLVGGQSVDDFAKIRCRWGDPAVFTRSAAADEATKLVGAGILPPNSRITYERVGLTEDEQAQVEKDWKENPSDAKVLAQALTPPEMTANDDTAG